MDYGLFGGLPMIEQEDGELDERGGVDAGEHVAEIVEGFHLMTLQDPFPPMQRQVITVFADDGIIPALQKFFGFRPRI